MGLFYYIERRSMQEIYKAVLKRTRYGGDDSAKWSVEILHLQNKWDISQSLMHAYLDGLSRQSHSVRYFRSKKEAEQFVDNQPDRLGDNELDNTKHHPPVPIDTEQWVKTWDAKQKS